MQLSLFVNYSKIECPTYKKVYSVYAYDRVKYMAIWARIKKLAERFNNIEIFNRVSPYRVLKLCYIKENGKIKSNGDVKHVFRLGVLQRIYSVLYYKLYKYSPDLMTFYDDEYQAEIEGTQEWKIKDKVKIHIKLLKMLKSNDDYIKVCELIRNEVESYGAD